ncbi:hypothetical protein ACFVWY_08745 [Streptomyces sp. NPDC058195]|uniref:hypothetical protein n=1 Tax=Streptomyces sp. NPDC058195 TaxID=3346375 RepID=UPI0036F004F5
MSHRCPPNCHRCPDLDDDVMPGCMGTATNQGTPATARLLTWCTCSANRSLPAEDNANARIAALEARIAELEART